MLLNPNQCNKDGSRGRKQEPIIDPVSGQKFPPPPRQMPDYGSFWKFPFKDCEQYKEINKKIKVDWDRWQDEQQNEDLKDDFNPDKLIDLLKKNGEWSDEEYENEMAE